MSAEITVIGWASKDAETKDVGDKKVTKISVPNKVKEKTDWFDIEIWGNEYASKIKKGDFVVASGMFTTNESNGKTYLKVKANRISSCRPAPKSAAPAQEDDVAW